MPEAQKMASEKRLIDANALKSKLQDHKDFFVDAWRGFSEMTYATKCRVDEIDNCIAEIVNAPTVDAVEVVRCKKCLFSKYFEESGTRKCRTQNGMYRTVEDSDFCSYGEREDNEAL